jgi:hypothetical protein
MYNNLTGPPFASLPPIEIPDADARREALEWLKHDFRRNATVTDPV